MIAIVVIFVLILGVVGYTLMMRQGSMSQVGIGGSGSGEDKKSTAKEMAFKGNISNLIERGDKLKCDFADTINGLNLTGVMYVSGAKVRGDFTINAGDNKIENYMIVDGDNIYTWSGSAQQGMKITKAQLEQSEVGKNPEDSFGLQRNFDLDCKNWTEESSKFVVPTNVTFTEMSATQ